MGGIHFIFKFRWKYLPSLLLSLYEVLQDIVYIRLPPGINFGKLFKRTEITQMGYFWSPLDS